jgi:hypothetical protein
MYGDLDGETMEIYGDLWMPMDKVNKIPENVCPKEISRDLRILMGYKGK